MTQACQEHNFEQIEAWIDEGMAPNTLFQGPNGGAFTHLIIGHPEGTKVGKGFRRSDDEVCAFITKLKETHSVKLVPIQHGDPKSEDTLHQGYVKVALESNHPKIAKCLYALGVAFDGSFCYVRNWTFEQYLRHNYNGNPPHLSPAVYSFITSVSN